MRSSLVGDEASDEARVAEILDLLGRLERGELAEGYEAEEVSPREGYAAIVRQYDARLNPLILAEEPVVQSLLADAAPAVALDAACGTGRHTAFLASRGHDVVAVNLSPDMLDRAIARVPHARFLVADLSALPLAGESVDLAVCALALTHLPDLGPPVAELARVLRPRGRLVVSDVHPFAVLLGAHVLERSESPRRVLVRNHVHLHADYLSAFAGAGLQVRRCLEATVGERELDVIGPPDHLRDAFRQAFLDLPIALVWDLERVPELTREVGRGSPTGTGREAERRVDPSSVLVAMVDAFVTGDLSQVSQLVADHYLDHQGIGGRPLVGVDGFAQVVEAARFHARAHRDDRRPGLREGSGGGPASMGEHDGRWRKSRARDPRAAVGGQRAGGRTLGSSTADRGL